MKNFLKNKTTIWYLVLILIIGQQNFKNKAQALNKNNQISEQQKVTQPQDKKQGWSEWRSWKNFPHNQIQLGMSNSDYGGMMDLEYKCFNRVSSENNAQKDQTYWYRISEQKELSEYFKIEVGCWQENQFTSTSIVNGLKINNPSSPNSNSQLLAQTIKNCPRELTGLDIIRTFETKNYSIALCQQYDSVYLVGHEKQKHEAFISAKVTSQNDDLIIAEDEDGFYFELSNNQLKVIHNDKLIAEETLLNQDPNQNKTELNSESKLTGVIWHLQEICDNNDELIEVDNPANYTIEFLPNGKVKVKADCKSTNGNYVVENKNISMILNPTTLQICSSKSIADKYLTELQFARIFFFQDGNLYFDLKADTGTMKFIPQHNKTELDSESKLMGKVWQLQEIRYNNDELIEVNNPANYTIQFLPDGQLSIKADCNRARGIYTVQDSRISIQIGATTRAMCPPESISNQYLKELESATIFFFKDGNLYFDLKFDTGTMKFISEVNNQEKDPEFESEKSSKTQNSVRFTGPSSVGGELEEDTKVREKRSLLPGVDNALQPWFDWKKQVNQDVGLNFGLDYNIVYQKLTNSLNIDEAGGGIFRFFGDWTLLGRNTDHPGSVVFKVENRHDFGKVAPQNLGFQAGYSGITSTQYSDFGWGVTNLFWKQKFNNGRISFLIGKVDPTDYVDIYALTNPQTHFQNLAFLTNPTISAPNQGLGMALGAMISDNVYLVTGFSDANGEATEAGFDTFFNDGEYFKHFEIGWTSSPDRIYFDNIHLTAWHSDAREKANTPETWGLAMSASWFVDDLWMPFLRGGYSNGGASLMKGSVSAGLGRYFPESGNLLGFGLNWGQPADTNLDSQVTTEIFYRIQVTQNWAITPDIQVLFNPALSPDKSAIAVFAIRSRINF